MFENGCEKSDDRRAGSPVELLQHNNKGPGIRPQAAVQVEKIPYRAGDRFILCSDGIWNCEPEPEIIKMFNASKRPDEALRYLTERVNAIGIQNGESTTTLQQ